MVKPKGQEGYPAEQPDFPSPTTLPPPSKETFQQTYPKAQLLGIALAMVFIFFLVIFDVNKFVVLCVIFVGLILHYLLIRPRGRISQQIPKTDTAHETTVPPLASTDIRTSINVTNNGQDDGSPIPLEISRTPEQVRDAYSSNTSKKSSTSKRSGNSKFIYDLPQLSPLLTVEGSHHPALAACYVTEGKLAAWGASRRGRRHAKSGAVREDAFAMNAGRYGLVAVVADGVGSTTNAQLASTAAATACAAFPWEAASSETDWRTSVKSALVTIQAALWQSAPPVPASRSGIQLQDPSTTLAMALVIHNGTHSKVFWFTVGDSALMRLERNLTSVKGLSIVNEAPMSPDNNTAALPTSNLAVETGSFELDLRKEFLILATDGCWRPIRQNPEDYVKDFIAIAAESADASHLLASIRQDGSGFDDDSTAILITQSETTR